ncbi:CbiX/SirB N-terminal domain-containing protein [Ruegeria aquimaris]|uniref:Cobalamin biosynthesis protein CbiX n=1 Tax=Ruegeria aquimaris TaxID=2984333 RepID=A0ABT3AQ71_9RHOB|nr:CbiX/SirB N-terminal domain-containing protein [Ruegeria sp. XHP0148]MCV2890221.1 cobalamin biosynthesis protein CbiX [Ruegeria sp. XHP0148]
MTNSKHVLLVAHGQPSDPIPAEDDLAEIAKQIQTDVPEVTVHSATLASPGYLETVLDRLPASTPVYPLFTSDGWFVTTALPRRLGSRANPIMPPMGIDPDLPQAVARHLHGTLTARGWQARDTELVVAAHGSGRSRNPAVAAERFANALQSLAGFARINVGYVEQEPSIAEAARHCGNQALCLPFFACAGGHVQDDIPMALTEASFKGDTLPVLGVLPSVTSLIARRISEHAAAATGD